MLSFLTNVFFVFLFVSGVIAVLWTFRGRIAAQDSKITSVFNEKETFIYRNWFSRLKKSLICYLTPFIGKIRSLKSVLRWIRPYQTQRGANLFRSTVRVSPLTVFWYQRRSKSLQRSSGLDSFILPPGGENTSQYVRKDDKRALSGPVSRRKRVQGLCVLLYFCYYFLDWLGPRSRKLALIPVPISRQEKSVRTSVHN